MFLRGAASHEKCWIPLIHPQQVLLLLSEKNERGRIVGESHKKQQLLALGAITRIKHCVYTNLRQVMRLSYTAHHHLSGRDLSRSCTNCPDGQFSDLQRKQHQELYFVVQQHKPSHLIALDGRRNIFFLVSSVLAQTVHYVWGRIIFAHCGMIAPTNAE